MSRAEDVVRLLLGEPAIRHHPAGGGVLRHHLGDDEGQAHIPKREAEDAIHRFGDHTLSPMRDAEPVADTVDPVARRRLHETHGAEWSVVLFVGDGESLLLGNPGARAGVKASAIGRS